MHGLIDRSLNRVSGAYAGIPLRAMYTLATGAGIPFDAIDDNDPAFKVPGELTTVLARTLSYVQGGSLSFSHEEARLLRQRYLHHSASWHVSGGGVLPLALFYVNRPADDGQRVVFPNEDEA